MSLGIFGSERTSRAHQILLGVTTAVALVFSLAIGPIGNAAGNSDSASMPAPEQASVVVPEAQGLNVSVEDQAPPEPATTPAPAPPPAPVAPPAPVTQPAPVEPPAPVKPPVATPPPAQEPAPTVDQPVPGSEENSDGEQAKPTPEVTEPETELELLEEEPEEPVEDTLLNGVDGVITWEVQGASGLNVPGGTFSLQGPQVEANWGATVTVEDCVGEPCAGSDLDPRPGKFNVEEVGSQRVQDSERYRIQPTVAPPGFKFDDLTQVQSPATDVSSPQTQSRGTNENPSLNLWPDATLNFGTFAVTPFTPTCQAGYIYSISTPGQLRQVAPNGAVTLLGTSAASSVDFNGLGIGPSGSKVYAYARSGAGNTQVATIQEYNTVSGVWASTGKSATTNAGTSISSWVAGGVNLSNGAYYLGGFGSKTIGSQAHTVFHLWKYTPGGAVNYQGYADVKVGTSGSSNGDLAFNSSGDLFIVRGDGSGVMIISINAANLGAATGGQIPASQSANRTVSIQNVNGIAFDSSGRGYLGNGTQMNSYTMPGWTGQASVTGSLVDSTDLASCSSPASISLYKNVAGQRVKVGDQFKLKLASPSLATPESALTTGSASGQQSEHIGPLPVARGTSFTFSETFENGALAGDYASAWACTLDGAAYGSGTGSSGTVTIPTSGESVVCEFTNAPLVAHVTLRKEVKGVGQNDWVPRTGWPMGITVAGTPNPVVTPLLPGTQATGADGSTSWKIKFGSKTGKAKVGVFENAQPNFDFDSGTCTVTKLGGTPTQTPILSANGLSFPGIAPGDNVDCTFRNKEIPASIVVNKQWVLNGGEPIANPTQPLGLNPDLTINGDSTSWGTTVGPFAPADSVALTEATTIDLSLLPTCVLESSMIAGNGLPAPVSILDEEVSVVLEAGLNTYMVTNAIACDQELILTKQVDNLVDATLSTVPWKLDPSDWSQGLFAASGSTDLIFDSGEVKSVPEGTYDLSEQAKPGYELTDLTCEGGELDGTIVTVGFGQSVSCTFTNTIAPGSVIWEKQNAFGDLLAGSEWILNGPDALELEVTDCTAGLCPGPDQNPAAGKISLTGLNWGSYTLVETRAPAGYQLDATPITFVVGPDNTDPKVLMDWNLGVVENDQQEAPSLPLTGGLGTQIFLLVGGSALGIAAGMTAWRRKKGALQTL